MKKKIKIKEALIDENSGVYAIALVEQPAIEENFLMFSEDIELKFSILSDEEQIFVGPVMLPNKKIKRLDDNNEKYYIFYSADTIKKMAYKYLIDKNQANVNLEHKLFVDNVILVESWISTDSKSDKSYHLFNKEYPAGTWFATIKVLDTELWNTLKESNFNGFSLQGDFIVKDHSEIIEEVFSDKNNTDDINIINDVYNILIINDIDMNEDEKIKKIIELVKEKTKQ